MIDRLAAHGITLDADAILEPAMDDPTQGASAGPGLRGRWSAPASSPTPTRRSIAGSRAAARRSCRGGRRSRGGASADSRGGRHRVARASVLVRHDDWIPPFVAAGLDALEAYPADHDAAATDALSCAGRAARPRRVGRSDYHGDEIARQCRAGQRLAAARARSTRSKIAPPCGEPRDGRGLARLPRRTARRRLEGAAAARRASADDRATGAPPVPRWRSVNVS